MANNANEVRVALLDSLIAASERRAELFTLLSTLINENKSRDEAAEAVAQQLSISLQNAIAVLDIPLYRFLPEYINRLAEEKQYILANHD